MNRTNPVTRPFFRLAAALLVAAAPLFAGCVAATDGADQELDAVEDQDDGVAAGAALRFDVATLNCGGAGAVCAPEQEKCLCMPEVERLNYDTQPHFLAVGTDNNKEMINGAGNYQAIYVDRLNDGWAQTTGAQWADNLVAELKTKFPKGLPKWMFMNEISAGTWPDNASYRQFVVDVASRLKNKHGKAVIIAAPFARPGKNAASWSALAQHAWIAAEVYLTGADINKSGNSVAWCQSQYQASVNAYTSLGVPMSKLMLVEHFGNTAAGTAWGRSGASDEGWRNAIGARSKAAQNLNFAGYISYSWASNQMHDTEAARLSYIDTYANRVLP